MGIYAFGCLAVMATGSGSSGGGGESHVTKRVILMIGSGMGYNQTLATDYFRGGGIAYGDVRDEDNALDYVALAMSTYDAEGGYDPAQAWQDFDYMKQGATSSAAVATAMATRYKTIDDSIGLNEDEDEMTNIIEYARGSHGRATGIVTTRPMSDPTVAAFVVHGNADIIGAETQDAANARAVFSKSHLELMMATGHPEYDDNGAPRTPVYDYISDDDWNNVFDLGADGQNDINLIDDDGKDPDTQILTFTEDIRDLVNASWPPISEDYPAADVPRYICIPQVSTSLPSESTALPSLKEMTLSALHVLEQDPDGFFLVVVADSIQTACAAGDQSGMIQETVAFQEAVAAVIDWVNAADPDEPSEGYDPNDPDDPAFINWENTTLIVTADHETGYLWGPGSDPDWEPIVDNGAGTLPGMAFYSADNTNSLVPLWACGAGWQYLNDTYANENDDDPDHGRGPYLDNTELGQFLFWAVEYHPSYYY